MNIKYILIIGNKEDYHSTYIYNQLKLKGEKVFMFNIEDFPRVVDISYSPTLDVEAGIIYKGKKFFIKSVFWRYYKSPNIEYNKDYNINYSNLVSSIKGFLDNLNCLMINKPGAFYLHWIKPKQLKLIYEENEKINNNIKIPETIITNNFSEIELFIKKDKEYIYKPTQGGYSTQKYSSDKVIQLLLAKGPLTFQEYIKGDDIRVYIIGKKLYSIKIKTKRSDIVDFRDDNNHEIIIIDIPQSLKNICKRISIISNYLFTAIDIKKDEIGNYYILEANPSPMFISVENKTNLPITNDLINLLQLKS